MYHGWTQSATFTMIYLTRKDFEDKVYGIDAYLPGDPSTKSLGIKTTSGTTGGKLPFIVVKNLITEEKKKYLLDRLSATVRIRSLRTTNLNTANHFLRDGKLDRLLLVDRTDLKSGMLPELIERFKPREIIAQTSYFNACFELIEKAGKSGSLADVKELYLTGEVMSDAYLKRFKIAMPAASYHGDYGMSQADWFTTSCEHLSRRHPEAAYQIYHPFKSHHIEIIDPDESGMGEIVLSTPEFSNYRTGDLGSLIREVCACGEDQALTVYGRKEYDVIHAAGATFLVTQVEKLFQPLAHLVQDYCVEIGERMEERNTIGLVQLAIVPTNSLMVREEKTTLIAAIFGALQVTQTRRLQDLIDEGLFSPIQVRFEKEIVQQTSKKIRMKKILPFAGI